MLNELLPDLQSRIQDWGEDTLQKGWITESQLNKLTVLDNRLASDLFESEERPLVVGFFGGTGVGKSSLLNRLAGESIARTGVERPTSREVTVYVHEQVSADSLPKDLPTDNVSINQHNNIENHDILWVDMPDFDSAEQKNREIVLRWLPYLDVLIYVVSPERYKDDSGWKLLLEHGERHAWLFVINHWDRGNEVQRQDFNKLLGEAGLNDPIILRTNCNSNTDESIDDDFEELKDTVHGLASDNIIKHLEDRGINLRAQRMQQLMQSLCLRVGSPNQLDSLQQDLQQLWSQASDDIKSELHWSIKALSQRFTAQQSSWLTSIIATIKGGGVSPNEKDTPVQPSLIDAKELWDERTESRVTLALNKLVQQAILKKLPPKPIEAALEGIKSDVYTIFNTELNTNLKQALNEPGTLWQRKLYKIIGHVSSVLPGLVLVWIAYEVIAGFITGNSAGGQYLGVNFAIHSFLLVGLAWFLPYYLMRKTQPSLQQAAESGMQKGTNSALAIIEERIVIALENTSQQQQTVLNNAEEIFSSDILPEFFSQDDKNKILQRMLISNEQKN